MGERLKPVQVGCVRLDADAFSRFSPSLSFANELVEPVQLEQTDMVTLVAVACYVGLVVGVRTTNICPLWTSAKLPARNWNKLEQAVTPFDMGSPNVLQSVPMATAVARIPATPGMSAASAILTAARASPPRMPVASFRCRASRVRPARGCTSAEQAASSDTVVPVAIGLSPVAAPLTGMEPDTGGQGASGSGQGRGGS
jgi:hypothetical protein